LTPRNTSFFKSVQMISTVLHLNISKLPRYLLSEVSKFQQHTKLCSICSTLLVASLNVCQISWWKELSSCWTSPLRWQSWT
jgi:hypothetical protein